MSAKASVSAVFPHWLTPWTYRIRFIKIIQEQRNYCKLDSAWDFMLYWRYKNFSVDFSSFDSFRHTIVL